jgi:ankyrin repeat protein
VKLIIGAYPQEVVKQTGSCWTPLMTASEAGHTEIIEFILSQAPYLWVDGEHERVISQRELLFYKCLRGGPLHAAITGQHPVEALEALLEYEGDSNIVD